MAGRVAVYSLVGVLGAGFGLGYGCGGAGKKAEAEVADAAMVEAYEAGGDTSPICIQDWDRDGFYAKTDMEGNYCGGSDCDDNDASVYPGAEEICDGKDNDCDGLTDGEDIADICRQRLECIDNDGDGYGIGKDCNIGGDCNDNDASIYPGASEDLNNSGSCNVTDLDGKDNDCDGVIDESCMVNVPAGVFKMGCDAMGTPCYPEHLVTLTKSYDVDEFEVTNKQYEKCVEKEWCTAPSKSSSYTHPNYYGNPTFEDYPVIYVTWYQAGEYCQFAGKRLPTEAEWEKAARGTDERPYPWGSSEPDCSKVNYNMCVGDVTKVGSYPGYPSPYGAYDMAGNVMEWISDWNALYSGEDETDPTGPETGTEKVKRGGDFVSPDGNDYIKTFKRYSDPPGNSKIQTGFRCVKEKE